MNTTAYGPVPLSRLKVEAAAISKALDRGERVLISRHGDIIAELSPPSRLPQVFLSAFAANVPLLPVVTTRDFQRGNVSEYVAAAARGAAHLVTSDNRLAALLAAPYGQPGVVASSTSGGFATVDAARAHATASAKVLAELDEGTSGEDVLRALADVSVEDGDTDTSADGLPATGADWVDEKVDSALAYAHKADDSGAAITCLADATLASAFVAGETDPTSLIAQNNLLVHLAAANRRQRWVVEAMRSTCYGMRETVGDDDDRAIALLHNLHAVEITLDGDQLVDEPLDPAMVHIDVSHVDARAVRNGKAWSGGIAMVGFTPRKAALSRSRATERERRVNPIPR